ncbi:alpha/beta fold hydrolase [Rhodobacterales bacterium HKCCE2091]|nr:alpha/beta fold hydrolase [Rhodobacterales bacterium HKCCE2091]
MPAPLVLVHGSGHGAWCWRDVLPLLGDAVALDMPAMGDDTTPAAEVTLEAQVAAIGTALDRPAVLVGHSLGGIAITAAAEAFPDRVLGLVYVCAWVPGDGQSAKSLRAEWGCEMLMDATIRDPGGVTTTIDPAKMRALFYQDCPDEAVAFAAARLKPQPIAPGNTPVARTGATATIPRHYVRCMQDNAIPVAYQNTASADWPAANTHDLDCGHSPFFACPGKLAEILVHIAETS